MDFGFRQVKKVIGVVLMNRQKCSKLFTTPPLFELFLYPAMIYREKEMAREMVMGREMV